MYHLKTGLTGAFVNVQRDSDGAFVPFDKANRDCVKFLEDWQAGVAVTDPDGVAVPYSPENKAMLGL